MDYKDHVRLHEAQVLAVLVEQARALEFQQVVAYLRDKPIVSSDVEGALISLIRVGLVIPDDTVGHATAYFCHKRNEALQFLRQNYPEALPLDLRELFGGGGLMQTAPTKIQLQTIFIFVVE